MLSAFEEAVIASDLQGSIVYWNPAAERLYGWRAQEVVGRKVQELIAPDGTDERSQEIFDMVCSGQRWQGELAVRGRDGQVFMASVTDSPVLDDDGNVVGVVGVSCDLSEKRWREARFWDNRESLRLALAAARVGTWRWEPATGAVEWDPSMETLYGLAEGGFPGTFAAWRKRIHPDDRRRTRTTFERALAEGNEFGFQHRVRWDDGSEHWIEGRGRVTHDESGEVKGAVGVAVDATDRMRAEQALRAEHQIVETLHHIGSSLVAELDVERIVQAVTDAAIELTGAQVGAFEHSPSAAAFGGEGPVRLDDVTADARFGSNPPFPGIRSYLAVPVVSRSGEVIGGLFFGHEHVGVFDEHDERLVAGLASQASIALDNARLFQSAQEQRTAAEKAASRLARLHAMATRLAEARSVANVAAAVVDEGALALDALAVLLCALTEDGEFLEILAASGSAQTLAEEWPPISVKAPLPVIEAFRTGRAVLLPSVADRDQRYPDLAGLETVGQSFAAIPLEVEGQPFGALAVSFSEERVFSDEDQSLMEAIGLQAGQALGRARLADAERRAARTLQQSLLPPGELVVPGMEVAARYHAFGDETEVGGDFYDAFPSDGGYGVVMGDVRGKGIQSAAITALARYTVRAATQCDRSPSDALRMVNRAIYEQDDPERFCTIVHLNLHACDEGGFDINLVCAGHPLPLLLTAEGGVRSVGRPGMVVGLFEDPELHEVHERLAPGDALVLYTDGLLEARSPDGRFDPGLIEKALRGAAGSSAEDIAAAIERAVLRFEGGQPRDDMALLVLRVPLP
jgi:PAS domain S-box-containing protein